MQLITALTVPEHTYVFLRLRLDSIQKSITCVYIYVHIHKYKYILIISGTFILSLQKKKRHVHLARGFDYTAAMHLVIRPYLDIQTSCS
jgi:hypothetical protein